MRQRQRKQAYSQVVLWHLGASLVEGQTCRTHCKASCLAEGQTCRTHTVKQPALARIRPRPRGRPEGTAAGHTSEEPSEVSESRPESESVSGSAGLGRTKPNSEFSSWASTPPILLLRQQHLEQAR